LGTTLTPLNTKGRGMNAPSTSLPSGTWVPGDLTVARFGYGAMQLAGPGMDAWR